MVAKLLVIIEIAEGKMKRLVILFIVITLEFLSALDVDFIERDLGTEVTEYVNFNSEPIPALSYRGTLLEDHFGVYPTLQALAGGDGTHAFNWNSLAPTKNTETVSWVESDYYGPEGNTGIIHGTFPSGGERYDVEALYFHNDDDYLYIAILTSVPHYQDLGNGISGIGVFDDRYTANGLWVLSGDISLDFGLGTARNERTSTWHYNYGLDITHENRDVEINNDGYPTCDLHDTLLGSELYRTYADAGSNVINPPSGESDWHTALRTGAVQADWEHTNFDPSSSINTTANAGSPNIAFIGDASDGIVTAYYELAFAGGYVENGQKTYVIEATIPRSLFGADNPSTGESVGFRFTPACRNDGDAAVPIIKLTTTIKGYSSLGDYVWHDVNQNGKQDDGAPSIVGIGGITVNLYDDSNTIVRTTTTNSSGYYNFANLIPKSYYVEFLKGSWGEITSIDYTPENDDGLDSDAYSDDSAPGYGQTGIYTLIVDQHEPSVDCGLFTVEPLPVTLSTFSATYITGVSRLQWITQSESNNALWNIYRAVSQNVGQSVIVNYESIAGAGTTSEPTNYNFYDQSLSDFIQDQNLVNPTIYYWLESMDHSGNTELHGPVSVTVLNSGEGSSTPEIPDVYGLNQNYPNTFNPDTGISFNLAKDGRASLHIYNVKGEKVKTLFQYKEYSKNITYTEHWNGKDSRGNTVSSGIYLAVLKADKELFTRKMILQK